MGSDDSFSRNGFRNHQSTGSVKLWELANMNSGKSLSRPQHTPFSSLLFPLQLFNIMELFFIVAFCVGLDGFLDFAWAASWPSWKLGGSSCDRVSPIVAAPPDGDIYSGILLFCFTPIPHSVKGTLISATVCSFTSSVGMLFSWAHL